VLGVGASCCRTGDRRSSLSRGDSGCAGWCVGTLAAAATRPRGGRLRCGQVGLGADSPDDLRGIPPAARQPPGGVRARCGQGGRSTGRWRDMIMLWALPPPPRAPPLVSLSIPRPLALDQWLRGQRAAATSLPSSSYSPCPLTPHSCCSPLSPTQLEQLLSATRQQRAAALTLRVNGGGCGTCCSTVEGMPYHTTGVDDTPPWPRPETSWMSNAGTVRRVCSGDSSLFLFCARCRA
jgi:hypothetical protein